MRTALVTGSAGFIGYHLSMRLLADGWRVVGFDALSDYYDVGLKRARHDVLGNHANFECIIARLEDRNSLAGVLGSARFDAVFHLAAQAGVRHSIDAPDSYRLSNLDGTFALLEAVRHNPVPHLLMASTSSIYGANTEMPYKETDRTVTQMSFYAATKAANEAMAHAYAHLYGQPTTMFRFFTVYGPWGRPDMAYFKFTSAILNGDPIEVYNHGQMRRDFTYIDDLVEALIRLTEAPPARPTDPAAIPAHDSLSPVAPFRVVNIGNARPVALMDFIAELETALGHNAEMVMTGMQPGDVPATWADTTLLKALTGYVPATPVAAGVPAFVKWFRDYYGKPAAS